jgi:hypothetical protein
MSKRAFTITLIVILCTTLSGGYGAASATDEDDRYYEIQRAVIQASMALEFEPLGPYASTESPFYLKLSLSGNFHTPGAPSWTPTNSEYFFTEYLSSQHNVKLERTDSGYRVFDVASGEYLNVFERQDWEIIRGLTRDCNTLLKERGRLACEFDGGYNYCASPFTTFLFNIAFLKYQDQGLVYRDGRYTLLEQSESEFPLDMYDLLKRNAVARVICYQLVSKAASILLPREEARVVDDAFPPKTLTYEEMHDSYYWSKNNWRDFLEKDLKIGVSLSDTGFEVIDRETNEKILFPHDQDLIDQALKELNYYREKVNFSEHFMYGNYPMLLLSILRIYDVNLQIDEASGKVVIHPGPTDSEAFFDIVAECTFVDDPSDTEYLKQHLTTWREIDKPERGKGSG